jgi:hypothetical protein
MVKKMWLQCQSCGVLYKQEVECDIEDTYIQEECPKCRDETTHLVCGTNEDELYWLYNVNVDPQYYKY